MRDDIALPLQHVLQIYTVGALLTAWRSPKNHRSIEQVFDSPQQARHAVAVCATWLGVTTLATPNPIPNGGCATTAVVCRVNPGEQLIYPTQPADAISV